MARIETTFVSTVFMCTTLLLLLPLVFSTQAAESYGVPRLNADFSFLTELLSGRSMTINAWPSALQEGIWSLSYLLISFGCGYFPLRWTRNYLDQSEHFGSNFH